MGNGASGRQSTEPQSLCGMASAVSLDPCHSKHKQLTAWGMLLSIPLLYSMFAARLVTATMAWSGQLSIDEGVLDG